MTRGFSSVRLYSEDGFSFWAITAGLPRLLNLLGDPTPPDSEKIVAYYRPSFGRAEDAGLRKQFGEFDLLLGTPEGVYPIESKPEKCGQFNPITKVLTLRAEQVRRHEIFRTYRKLWAKYCSANWTEFRELASKEFEALRQNWEMPRHHNLLAKNIEQVLRSLEACGDEITDTLLYFHRPTDGLVVFTSPHGFKCISMPLDMEAGSNFLTMKFHLGHTERELPRAESRTGGQNE